MCSHKLAENDLSKTHDASFSFLLKVSPPNRLTNPEVCSLKLLSSDTSQWSFPIHTNENDALNYTGNTRKRGKGKRKRRKREGDDAAWDASG